MYTYKDGFAGDFVHITLITERTRDPYIYMMVGES